MPARHQLRRTKGYRKPEGVVVITRPHSIYANPFKVGVAVKPGQPGWLVAPEYAENVPGAGMQDFTPATVEEAVAMYRTYIDRKVVGSWTLAQHIEANLRGLDVACYCALNAPCHGDVVLEVANR